MNEQFMIIDDIPVEIKGEKNILEVIRKAGIDLPTLCYYSELSVYGACRMCMVENKWGGIEAACSTPPKAGMEIYTNTPRLRKYRKNILELLLSNHCRDCTTCEKNGHCKLQELAHRFGIRQVRFDNTAEKSELDTSSLCIVRDKSKCILCGDCVRMCNEIQNVGAIDFIKRGAEMSVGTVFDKPIAESNCVGCGQCAAVCPTGAIVVKDDTQKLWKDLSDKNTKVLVQIAPLENNERLPLFTSCCPAWVNYVERTYPEMMNNISTCKSPMQMFGSVLKEHYSHSSKRIVNVAIMPCTAKKFEADRDEFKVDGVKDVDYVITTQELIAMIKEAGIVFSEIEPEAVDMPFGVSSGAGVIFGVTGGVTEAVLRRVLDDKSVSTLRTIAFNGVRGMSGVKETSITVNDKELKIAVVSGLKNADDLVKKIKSGEAHYDFIEVMACPGGCVGGAGQPFTMFEGKQKRGEGLYAADKMSSLKRSEENPVMMSLYSGLLKGKVHKLLHVNYNRGE